MNLIKKFQNISYQYNLWTKGSEIVLGVSGGPDSVCMLDIFAKLQKKYDLRLIIAHVNYGLRGKDSDLDQKLVEKYASRNKLKLVVLKPKISRRGFSRGSASLNQNGQKKPSLYSRKVPSENQLREIRYNFFEKVRAKNKFDLIAAGHTLDDQVETYLMRLMRGSGLSGLASMKFKNIHPVKSASPSEIPKGSEANFTGQGGPASREFNRGAVIRPLLGITKKEILNYLKQNRLSYRVDKTNKEIPFLRNKVRNELIPLLEKKYNPSIKETLYKSSLNIAEDYDLISKMAEVYYKKHKNLKASEILKLHPALQKRVIIKAIEKNKPDLKDIESAHINEIIKIIKSAKSKRQTVKFQGLKITRIGDKLSVSLIK